MSRLSFSVVDCGARFAMADRLLEWAATRHDIDMVSRGADFVIHSCFGYDIVNHAGVRIFVTGENVLPDFNISDYAYGFAHLDFGDRYCRMPLHRFYRDRYRCLLDPRPPADALLASKTGFCAFVASNPDGDPARRRIVDLLNRYKRVDMGGHWMNNVGGPVPDKLAFQRAYKFAVAFENSSSPGYVTEKIADAFASCAIPIYWGDPAVARDFNPEAFVDCRACGSLEAAVERVKQLDRDDEACRRMLAQPCFRDNRLPPQLSEEHFRGFLLSILEQPVEQAFRRNRGRWGRKYERRLEEAFHRPHRQIARHVRDAVRSLRRAGRPYAWPPPR